MNTIGLFGYGLAAVGYLLFAFLLFAARNKTVLAKWILISALVTVCANAVAAFQIELGFSLQFVMLVDSVKIACWSVLILLCNVEFRSFKSLIKNKYIQQYLGIWIMLVLSSWLATRTFNYSYEYLFLLFIVLNLWSLVLLEQLFRSANEQIRWAIWPLIIAIASVSVFDFVLYAQATMVASIDFQFWYSRGFIAAVVLPLLLVSTRRIRNGSVRIFVSRNVVFYSSMLMIAGLYLLVMAIAGYLINYFGGKWGDVVSIGFLVLSGIVLVALLITESLRRNVKVFIAKNFFANKYEYRDEWLNLIEKIETSTAGDYYQMATQIMMSTLKTSSGAIIRKITDNQFNTLLSIDLDITKEVKQQLGSISRFCQSKGWIVDMEEYQRTPTLYPNLSIDAKLCIQSNIRIVIPIFIGKAFYGFFLLGDSKEIGRLNWEDRDLFFAISKQLGNFVSLHEANDKLAESKQFDAFNRMSAFLVHDLKNVQAQLGLINKNAEKHRDNPEFIDDVFETVESATERLEKVLSQLRNKQVAQSKSALIDVSTIVEKVVQQRNIKKPLVTITQISSCSMAIDGDTLHSVLNHLIQNAQEATNPDGWVKVSLVHEDKDIIIEISDNGCGMSPEFIKNRLFKPFDTTKGNAGMGIGVFEAKQFIESIAGLLSVDSEVGKGSTFQIELPINPVFE
ncbi:XrtA/PEP-CTERM system histidine kinase PrsK [Thalassotalea profundi]|uniref:histidine kinase n=1 Tax=Thalassotalea profundi TaxID=2036687 RepID=A0ABQ3IP07_9GAMM|nr:XrtA/PEP-CTERM system histidine kinase PrsK [Thalassotalea profundi]GHE89306.1 histidine kinase [Thalassotalea profundi]